MSMSPDQLPMSSGYLAGSRTTSTMLQFSSFHPSQFPASDLLPPPSYATSQWQSNYVANQLSHISRTEEFQGFSRSFSGPLTPAPGQQNIPSHLHRSRSHHPSSGQFSSTAPWSSRTPFNQQRPPQQEFWGFSESVQLGLNPQAISCFPNMSLLLNPILARMITDISRLPEFTANAVPVQFYELATIPPAAHLTIISSDQPWEIRVLSSGTHVTILDILERVYGYLRKRIRTEEYSQSQHRNEICQTWYRKLDSIESDSERAKVKQNGILRVDLLCGKTNVKFCESVDIDANGPILHMEFSAS